MILRNKDKERLLAIADNTLSAKVSIWAYGSRVNGSGHDTSDLDLVLRNKAEETVSLSEIFAFEEALKESNIPILVQTLDWHRVPKSFRENILQNYKVLR